MREIETCEHLIAYCHKLKIQSGLGTTDETPEELQKKLNNEVAIEELSKKVEEGKLERVKTKTERDEEAKI